MAEKVPVRLRPGGLDAGQPPAAPGSSGRPAQGLTPPQPPCHGPAGPASQGRRPGATLLALGFRPFFLAAGVWALFSLLVWLAMLNAWLPFNVYYGATAWHAHEMLFGYAAAVIAGFLLTATRNWTGMPTASGAELAGLVLLWLAARTSSLLALPGGVTAVLDVAFPTALALSLRRPLWQGPNPVNRVFVGLLGGMGLAALLVHLEALDLVRGTAAAGNQLMLGVVLLVLLLVTGRVMPFFTRAALDDARPRSSRTLEALTFVLAVAWVLAETVGRLWPGIAAAPWIAALALALAMVQIKRLAGWHDRRVWGIPILAVLYSGYLWLILGLFLVGLSHLGLLGPSQAQHALTVGTLGVLTLGMMSRVTLGHTGRVMGAGSPMIVAFVALNLAAALRVLGPLAGPGAYQLWIQLSGALWLLAFGLFLWVHAPMLVRPRIDGRPG